MLSPEARQRILVAMLTLFALAVVAGLASAGGR